MVGGDGTYYEVLNGLLFRAQTDAKYDLNCPGRDWMPSPLPVGIIPCGNYLYYIVKEGYGSPLFDMSLFVPEGFCFGHLLVNSTVLICTNI